MVRLTDSVQESVVYLGKADSTDESAIYPIGTAFIIAWGDARLTYLVTARHVVEDLTDVEPFGIRFNTKDGKGCVERPEGLKWHWPMGDEVIDLAVARYDPPSWADWRPIPPKAFADPEKIQQKNLGPGDLAYVVGGFSPLHGHQRNKPLVHTGHIAMFPGKDVGSSRVDLQACKLEYSIVSPK